MIIIAIVLLSSSSLVVVALSLLTLSILVAQRHVAPDAVVGRAGPAGSAGPSGGITCPMHIYIYI